jgi:hypothetical protein
MDSPLPYFIKPFSDTGVSLPGMRPYPVSNSPFAIENTGSNSTIFHYFTVVNGFDPAFVRMRTKVGRSLHVHETGIPIAVSNC